MKSTILILAAFSLIMVSCNNENKEKHDANQAKITAKDTGTEPKINSNDCYAHFKNRDTATLKINIEGNNLIGDLDYKLFEKDSNKGKIAGQIKGDTIIAEYTFISEGVKSVREVAFLKKADGNLYEGFGEVMEKNGKMVFKNHSALKFDDSMVFTKTDCK
ncbi:hypothetical protein FBD94_11815 [Pedobacter hiemivivus]|uniref:Uncharacterized protein n=1 Tax=Pedobacter hiemivivus TaxID=2530454 RepID=A0A4R0MKG7_9SPHI|nr:hypothetical protein [Pedobacter hiemivivus]TCC87119.1 hypothetical protein EZ444_22985 [Pedobacter hiemivivus]TKC61227.1 hypothetical protein FBD94_11815 [Pedobacter hiemivivus]